MDESLNQTSHHTDPPQTLDYASPTTDPKQPFPWRRIFEWMIAIGVILIVIVLLLPPIGRARTTPSNRILCAINLHQLGNTLAIQAQSNGGLYPDSWEAAILAQNNMSPQEMAKLLVCPQSHDTPATGTTAQQVAGNLHSLGRPMQFLNTKNPPSLHVSYIYLGKGLRFGSNPKQVLAFELPEHHDHSKDTSVNVLWTNGAVRTYTFAPAPMQKLMAEFQAGQNPPDTLKVVDGFP